MFAKSIMIPKHRCIVVNIEDTVETALNLLENRGIDCIPVLNGDEYAGVITHYHIYKNFFESNSSKEEFVQTKRVRDIATHQEKYLQSNLSYNSAGNSSILSYNLFLFIFVI